MPRRSAAAAERSPAVGLHPACGNLLAPALTIIFQAPYFNAPVSGSGPASRFVQACSRFGFLIPIVSSRETGAAFLGNACGPCGGETMANESGELVDTRPQDIRAGDYEMIEQAVMETARGRWFLGEYARRIREHESAKVLAALSRLEQTLRDNAAALAGADGEPPIFGRTARPDEPGHARAVESGAATCATFATETEEVCAVQEKLLDIVWYMRERGFDGQLCTAIDRQARRLARFHQRLEPGPASPDRQIDKLEDTAPALAPEPAAHMLHRERNDAVDAPEPALDPPCRPQMAPSLAAGIAQRVAAFATIDAMSERERLELFA